MTFPRSRFALAGCFLSLLLMLAACSEPATPVTPSTDASEPAASSTSAAASESAAESVGVDPSASAEEASGIALIETDIAELMAAYEGYGFVFQEPVTDPEDGMTRHLGFTAEEQVGVLFTADGEGLTQILLVDYSAGEEGIEEMGFTIGIFAPEAQEWLVDQLETALASPGESFTATQEFEFVELMFDAYIDEEQSIDLYVRDPA